MASLRSRIDRLARDSADDVDRDRHPIPASQLRQMYELNKYLPEKDLPLVRREDCDSDATWAEIQVSVAGMAADVPAWERWRAEKKRLRPDPWDGLEGMAALRAMGAAYPAGWKNEPVRAALAKAAARVAAAAAPVACLKAPSRAPKRRSRTKRPK
jgi:hypothetical protein